MRIGWLDCTAGASGNMLLGALLSAGASSEFVARCVAAVHPELRVGSAMTQRHQISALLVHVTDARTGELAERSPEHHHRGLGEVTELLAAAELPGDVRGRALGVFQRLAEAEAAAHGVEPSQVHFHEVGALDAIGDIVGCAAAFHDLGLDEVTCSPVTLGGGAQTSGEHGRIPIPGPAVLVLLAQVRAPVAGGLAALEMTTPTGAALVAEYATRFGPLPSMVVDRVGLGAGDRDPVEVANLCRIVIGEATLTAAGTEETGPADQTLLETNVDDFDPRLWPEVLDVLLAAGALDAWLTPIIMKKGRPAHTLSVLCLPEARESMIKLITRHTSAIGLRESSVGKHALPRSFVTVEVDGQPVRIKIATRGEEVVNAQPEFADVAAAAAVLDRPAKLILSRALAAYYSGAPD